MKPSDTELITLLAGRDEPAFEQVFMQYYKPLYAYAFAIAKEDAVAEETVQSVFWKLWDQIDSLSPGNSLAAYLYRSVHHEALDHIKHMKVRRRRTPVAHPPKGRWDKPPKKLAEKELENRLSVALNDIPEQCRTIYQLSRFEDLRYSKIAERLNLPVKTVENQMGKALKLLRLKLVDYLPLLVLCYTL